MTELATPTPRDGARTGGDVPPGQAPDQVGSIADLLPDRSATAAELVPDPAGGPAPDLAAELAARLAPDLIAGLPSGVVVVAADDRVVLANPVARHLGAVSNGRLAVDRLARLVAQTRRDGQPRDVQVDLPPPVEPPLRRPRPDRPAAAARVRTWLLGGGGHLVLILDDLTEARRVEAVRRDFVANVSHELKTPVGAIHILAEAIASASDDPGAVRRFAGRMAHESDRLGRLVQEIIDLSRLQGADPLPDPVPVPVGDVVAEAVDRNRSAAEARKINVVVVDKHPQEVCGDAEQLTTAVANLLDNAVAYSPSGTRVVVGVRRRRGHVELSVADEGIGIAERDLERVFERFYRADPARSRETGGTGLGLAIVKHVATNHGGTISLWSAEGLGSTFMLRLPAYEPPDEAEEPASAPARNEGADR